MDLVSSRPLPDGRHLNGVKLLWLCYGWVCVLVGGRDWEGLVPWSAGAIPRLGVAGCHYRWEGIIIDIGTSLA